MAVARCAVRVGWRRRIGRRLWGTRRRPRSRRSLQRCPQRCAFPLSLSLARANACVCVEALTWPGPTQGQAAFRPVLGRTSPRTRPIHSPSPSPARSWVFQVPPFPRPTRGLNAAALLRVMCVAWECRLCHRCANESLRPVGMRGWLGAGAHVGCGAQWCSGRSREGLWTTAPWRPWPATTVLWCAWGGGALSVDVAASLLLSFSLSHSLLSCSFSWCSMELALSCAASEPRPRISCFRGAGDGSGGVFWATGAVASSPADPHHGAEEGRLPRGLGCSGHPCGVHSNSRQGRLWPAVSASCLACGVKVHSCDLSSVIHRFFRARALPRGLNALAVALGWTRVRLSRAQGSPRWHPSGGALM